MKGRKTILIVEDHLLLRETWTQVIHAESDYQVVGLAESGEKALSLAATLRPNIVMMDINLPGLNGIETTKLLLQKVPETKVIAVSLFENLQYVRAMLKAGALGYLTKNASTKELIAACDEVLAGRRYLSQ